MISRRNYFTITIVMFIVFFLFQFSNVALESWNHYEENSYIIDTSEIPDRSDSYDPERSDADDFAGDAREMVVYIGEEEGAVYETVSLWAGYTKRKIKSYLSPEEYEEARAPEDQPLPVMMAIDAANIGWDGEESCEKLEAYVQSGIHLVFCNLPEVSVMRENQRLQDLLGIEEIREEEAAASEVYLHKGFLLGGEAFYQEEGLEEGIDFSFPWYQVSDENEMYLSGICDTESEETEEPAIIWEKDFETASVFAVNGDYMEDAAGLGILTAMSAKMKPYDIYPVVNARNMIYANYPELADENKEYMMEQYSQSLEGLLQNVIWPDLVAVRRESGVSISCMLAPQLDYEDDTEPDSSRFQLYMKLLNEQGAETGWSAAQKSDISLEEKTAKDYEFMQKALPTYQFTSIYNASLTDEEVQDILQEDLSGAVRTVVENCNDKTEVIGYLSEYVTRQSAVVDGLEDGLRHEFRIRCLETALGYNSVLVDVGEIIYPEKSDMDWVYASNTLRQNIQDYRIAELGFEHTTVSECDERIRSFLAVDYKERRENNSIYLERNDIKGSVWFVLRTDREAVSDVKGGSFRKLEDDVYLIGMEEQSAVITLKAAR